MRLPHVGHRAAHRPKPKISEQSFEPGSRLVQSRVVLPRREARRVNHGLIRIDLPRVDIERSRRAAALTSLEGAGNQLVREDSEPGAPSGRKASPKKASISIAESLSEIR